MRIEQVEPAVTFPLRQRVLRPGETVDELAATARDATHFAALDGREVIGTVSVSPAPVPWAPDEPGAWRLRGMATAEDRRGQGVGAALLAAALDHVRRSGGRVVWCNARVPARAFYERGGFRVHGKEWNDPALGPHIAMHTTVTSETPLTRLSAGSSGNR